MSSTPPPPLGVRDRRPCVRPGALPLSLPPRAAPPAVLGILVALLLAAACSNGDNERSQLLPPGAGGPGPTSIAYARNPASYTRNVPAAPNVPTVQGTVQSFSVAPPLPAGLALDPMSGAIAGTPTELTPLTPFTVTAEGPLGGTASVDLAISVQPGPEPPAGLSYPVAASSYLVGEPVEPLVPTVTGAPTAWTATPPLPDGLELDPFTGVVSGTPTATTLPTNHTVRASNVAGSATARLEIAVFDAVTGMRIDRVSHGFGVLLPHRTNELDADGVPTGSVVSLRTMSDLLEHVRPGNPVFSTTAWPRSAILPDGSPGNHFVAVRFTQDLDPGSVFDLAAAAAPESNLTGAIVVDAVDPATGASVRVTGRGFVDGFTPGGPDPANPGQLELERWVELVGGAPTAVDVGGGATPGTGFPGTQDAMPFAGAGDLVRPDTFVFVPDADGDLSTHETFPDGMQVRISLLAPRSTFGVGLLEPGLASATVGPDDLAPELAFPGGVPAIRPADGDIGVDPRTDVELCFTEPIQPVSIGPLRPSELDTATPAVQIGYGPPIAGTVVPFVARPASVFDLSRWILDPVLDLPGRGTDEFPCEPFARGSVTVLTQVATDLAGMATTLGADVAFTTGPGEPVVNAPVTPDAVLVGRAGARPGISLVDLNGFGAGTGTPEFDPADPDAPGNTNFPNNPNLAQGSQLVPPLFDPVFGSGTCTLAGGSLGPFTTARSSTLDDLLAGPPVLSSVSDMALGHALDTTFHGGPAPDGCRFGDGNPCAATSAKVVVPSVASGALVPGDPPDPGAVVGAENVVSWAPHPNPPPIVGDTPCVVPFLPAQEPTSVESMPLGNLLEPSADFLGDPAQDLPPQGIPAPVQNAFFRGPSQLTATCATFQIRQQIGYFLYVCDPLREEIVVLGSNRFDVLDRIPVAAPVELAISPDLALVAVTSGTGRVVFVDTDPASSTFHQVVGETAVGLAPSGLAWDPGGEDLIVCNEGEGSLSVLSAATLAVRKTVTNMLTAPFAVVAGQRQAGFGLERGVYFAFVLNRDGTLAVFESGPDGAGGVGWDDVVALAPFPLESPRAIALDPTALGGACWIAHEDPIDVATGKPLEGGGPALSLVFLDGTTGPVPIDPAGVPELRDMEIRISASLGAETLTGVPASIAFDDLRNFGGLPSVPSPLSSRAPLPVNGKSLVREPSPGVFAATNAPSYLFLSVPDSAQGGGAIDVVRLDTRERLDVDVHTAGVQSIPLEGPAILRSFFSQ